MPVYELMRKNERVTLMALNQSGGIEKCDYIAEWKSCAGDSDRRKMGRNQVSRKIRIYS